MERRLFSRSEIEVDGELCWTGKRFGRVKTHVAHVRTLDLSVDGARLIAETRPDLAIRSACSLRFRGVESEAVVLELAETPDGTLIRLALRHPPAEFLAAVEHWLPTEYPDARPEVRPDWAGG